MLSLIWETVGVAITLSIGSITFLTTAVFTGMIVVGMMFSTIEPPTRVVQTIDRQSAETKIAIWESLASITPTREVYLNLEKLYRYIEDEEMAKTYRKRAFELDPNNEEFVNDHWDELTPTQTLLKQSTPASSTNSAIKSSSFLGLLR